jgi:hypothetical protein
VSAALGAEEPGVAPPPVEALPTPASAVEAALTLVPPEPVPAPPADPTPAAPVEPATATAGEETGDVPAETPAEAIDAAEPLATIVSTAVPEPVEEEEAEAVEPAVEQVQPVNVNISVRVDSAGDDDAVTQFNAAVSAPLPGATAPEVRYQEPEQRYHDPSSADEAPAAPAAPSDTASGVEERAAPAASWNWTWTWSCGGAVAPEIVLPANYLRQIWNWNWNWNCDGKNSEKRNTETELPSQYHPVTSQYQPLNVNISIRIASPGNNGPVVQTNLAVAAAGLLPAVDVRPAALPLPGPLVSVEIAVPTLELVELVGLPAAEQDAGSPEDGAISTIGAGVATPTFSVLEPPAVAGRGDTTGAGAGTAVAVVSAQAIAALAPPGPAVAAGRRARAQERRPRTHVQPIAPQRVAAGTLGYASAAPLGAGGSDRTPGLAFLFLVPFLLALADAARRVAEEWKAEAAEPGRRREKPG